MEKNGGVVKGKYTEAIWNEIKAIPKLSKPEKIDLLERNVIGSMIGMLPPTEATLRGLFFDWVDESILWKVQGRLAEAIEKNNNRRGDKESYFKLAKRVMENDVIRSMTRRPAPDLIHRVATENGKIGNTYFEKGDIIILSLTGAMQGLEEKVLQIRKYVTLSSEVIAPKAQQIKAAILMPVRPFNLPWDPYMGSLPHF